MYKGKKIIAIIPARSGSKGVLDKNIKNLSGKPLMAYTIEAAMQANIFETIIVSTDSEKYATIARQYGAEVPFLRSEDASSDEASSWSVVKEVLAQLDQNYDIIVLLQPTSPLRTARNISEAVDLFFEKDADTVVSVKEFPHSMAWVNTIPDNLSLEGFVKPEYMGKRRQDLPTHYMLNGAVYILKICMFDAEINLFGEKSYAYIMGEQQSVDIDTELDFIVAEALVTK